MEIAPQIHQAIEVLRKTFGGTKVKLLSTEMYRQPPSEFCALGYLGADILVEDKKVFLGCESMAEEIAWNPMGWMIAEQFIYELLKKKSKIMEERQDVKLVRVKFKCPECETGYLEPTGQAFLTNPPMFPHKCNVCDYGQTFNENYPRLVHEPIEKEEVSPVLTEDQILQRLADLINYNNMCARATLGDLPLVTINDLKYCGDFISRYETMSKAQEHMTGEAYDEAENWLKENEDKYLNLINKKS